MHFVLKLMWRLALALLLCLTVAVLWIAWSTNRYLQNDIAMSASQVASVILDRERFGAGDPHDLPVPTILKSMAPGICVDIVIPGIAGPSHLCGGWGDTAAVEPAWFDKLMRVSFFKNNSVSRAMMFGGQQHGLVVASADPVIIIRRAWERFTTIAYAAIVMTIVTTVVSVLVVAHALLPAGALIRAMQKLGGGDLKTRVPPLRQPEFQRFADAFNQLADNLEVAHAERISLARRLFHVQEEERLGIARELHDEFGQCLTSAGALAASIESGAPEGCHDLAADAHLVGEIVARMKGTLRSALHKLRPPELEELGLAESLEALVGSWNQSGGPTRFRFRITELLPPVDRNQALAIYRIVQEGLTNAVRHGSPGNVWVELARGQEEGTELIVSIRDDGRSDGRPASSGGGLGILGMRERVVALGGKLLTVHREDGYLVKASLPVERAFGVA